MVLHELVRSFNISQSVHTLCTYSAGCCVYIVWLTEQRFIPSALVCCLCHRAAGYSLPVEHWKARCSRQAGPTGCIPQEEPPRYTPGAGAGRELRQALGQPHTPGVLAASCSRVACLWLGWPGQGSRNQAGGTLPRPPSGPLLGRGWNKHPLTYWFTRFRLSL